MTKRKTFTVHGSYGALVGDCETGLVVARPQRFGDWCVVTPHGSYVDADCEDIVGSRDECYAAFGNAACPYDDIVRFDVEEWRRTYPSEEPEGMDILDIGFWTPEGVYTGPELDWREEYRADAV